MLPRYKAELIKNREKRPPNRNIGSFESKKVLIFELVHVIRLADGISTLIN